MMPMLVVSIYLVLTPVSVLGNSRWVCLQSPPAQSSHVLLLGVNTGGLSVDRPPWEQEV